jgi:hypothetical protein
MRAGIIAIILALLLAEHPSAGSAVEGVWISREEIRALPTDGPAWDYMKKQADAPTSGPMIRDKSQRDNVLVLAKALVYARTGDARYRREVIDHCMRAIGTERGGSTLSLGRELAAYVVAADIVGLPADDDIRFRQWLRHILNKEFNGRTLRSTHETRPNNWGTHAGASRAAVARYLGDSDELARVAQVFKGWLGDRAAYAGFVYGTLDWQCDPHRPVGINPLNCIKKGHRIDGVLPDDQRRSGSFRWPPPKENYAYEALQGALVQAHILHRAGYDTFNWENRALLRAYLWLHNEAHYPAAGDDIWQLPLVDYHYKSNFWKRSRPVRPGKNMGWTDWTHYSSR